MIFLIFELIVISGIAVKFEARLLGLFIFSWQNQQLFIIWMNNTTLHIFHKISYVQKLLNDPIVFANNSLCFSVLSLFPLNPMICFQVMYVAATVPYLFLIVLLVRGLTLPGAIDGLLFYTIPRWEDLLKFSVRYFLVFD